MDNSRSLGSKRTTAVQRASRELCRRLGHQWRAGARLPPLAQLAAMLDCGQTNTHRAVRQLVADGWLRARRGSGTFVTPKAARLDGAATVAIGDTAIATAPLRDKRVTLVVEESDTSGAALAVLREDLSAAGAAIAELRVPAIHADMSPPPPWDVDGDAIISLNAQMDWPARSRADQMLVVISTRVARVDRAGRYDVVGADVQQGGYLAGRRLRERGYSAACFVGANPFERVSQRRFDETSLLCLRGVEIGWGAAVRAEHRLHRLLYAPEAGAAAVAEFLKLAPRPPAIVAATNELAVGFVHGAYAHGLRAPRDYQIIGCGGASASQALDGALTAVEFPMSRMARLAVRLLSERFTDADQPVRRVLLGGTLVPGTTSGPAYRNKSSRRTARRDR